MPLLFMEGIIIGITVQFQTLYMEFLLSVGTVSPVMQQQKNKKANVPTGVWKCLNPSFQILIVITRCRRQSFATSVDRTAGHLCSAVPSVCICV